MAPRRDALRIDRSVRISGRLDLNQRPFGPQPNALPDCATPRGVMRRSRGTAYVGSSYAEAGDRTRTGSGSLEGSNATNYTSPALWQL
jgi:hypothetical protein